MACEWWNPASYKSCVAGAAKSAAGDAFHSIAQSFGQAADHTVNWLWSQMNVATAVHLGGRGFDLELGITAAIAGAVAVGLFTMQILGSVLRREPGGLGRALKGLVVAFIGGGVAIAVVNLLFGATDALCAGVVKLATGTNIEGLGKLILGPSALTSTVTGSAALLLLSLSGIVASVIVYVALVVRKVLIVVTAVFAPIAFAGSLNDNTVSWTRRWVETTVALVVSKLILVLIFIAGYSILIAGAGLAGSGNTQKITQVISGVLVLFLAGFAPWAALRVVHFTGDHARQLHSLGSSAVGGAAAGGRMAQKAAPLAGRLVAPAAAGAAAAGGGSMAMRGQAFAGGESTAGNGAVGSPAGGHGLPGKPAGPGGAWPSASSPSSSRESQQGRAGLANGARSTMSVPAAYDTPTSAPHRSDPQPGLYRRMAPGDRGSTP